MKHFAASFVCATLLTGCATIFQAGAVVTSAPAIRDALIACVGDDVLLRDELRGPEEFFTWGFLAIRDKDPDTSLTEIAVAAPGYIEAVPRQWAALWATLGDRDCGESVAAWKINSEQAFGAFISMAEGNERYQKYCHLYGIVAPLAGLANPAFALAPISLPGCQAIYGKTL